MTVKKPVKRAKKKVSKKVAKKPPEAPLVKLEKKVTLKPAPEFNEGFVAGEAKRIGVPLKMAVVAAAEVEAEGGPTLVIEQREWSMDAKEHFKELYDAEVRRRQSCRFKLPYKVKEKRKDGTEYEVTKWAPCGVEGLKTIEEVIAHQSMHLMLDGSDLRTSRAMLSDVWERIHPTKEKTTRAALTTAERRQMMLNPRLRERLLMRH